MHKFKLSTILFAFLFSFSIISCSDDPEDDIINEEGVDLIVGEWLVVSENDYACGTNDVVTERAADPNQIRIFNEDGTWEDFENGTPDWTGTWDYLGDGIYSMYYDDDQVTQTFEVEFVDNGNTMRFGVDDPCVEINAGNIYTYTVWNRQ